MNADATDCDSFNNPRTCPGRRLEDVHPWRSLSAFGTSVANTHVVEGRRLAEVCANADNADIEMREITFGSDNTDPSGAALVAFFLAFLGSLLCLIATCFACKAKYKQVQCLLGFALTCNCCYYIYMIPYEPASHLTVKPGYGWGAGCNVGAMINLSIGLLAATKAGAGPKVVAAA
jgi:hypothetical protein